jgi:hypothetical protein
MVKKVDSKIEVLEETPVISDIPSDSEPEEEPQTIQKSKRPRTEKQKEAFLKVIEKRTENRKMRADNREKEAKEKAETDAREALERKKLLEKKIVKKANIIAKKELKKHIALDDISSDEDESDTEVKKKLVEFKRKVVEKVMKTVAPPVPEVPKYRFV